MVLQVQWYYKYNLPLWSHSWKVTCHFPNLPYFRRIFLKIFLIQHSIEYMYDIIALRLIMGKIHINRDQKIFKFWP